MADEQCGVSSQAAGRDEAYTSKRLGLVNLVSSVWMLQPAKWNYKEIERTINIATGSIKTMESGDHNEALRLVRSYSWKVDQRIPPTSSAYPLSQALVDQREALDSIASPWRALLESTNVLIDNE